MDRRSAPRFEADHRLRVTVLRPEPEEVDATIVNVSKTGMRLLLERPVAHGTPVRLEWEDVLLEGAVVYCQSLEQQYAIGLQLACPLLDTQLARLARTPLTVQP